jgi:hypothetical protein
MRKGRRSLLILSCLVLVTGRSIVAQAVTKRLRATVDLTIGGDAEGKETHLFEDIRGLAFDAQGNVIVADSRANNVRVFRKDGLHLYTIGRAGAGPGDLLGPCCVTATSGGRLWVQESGNFRYSVFATGSRPPAFLRSLRMPRRSVSEGDRVTMDRRGNILHLGHEVDNAKGSWVTLRAWIDSAGKVVGQDSLPEPPSDSLAIFEVRKVGASATYTQPYGPRALRALGPNGEVAEAVSSRYRVVWLDDKRRQIAMVGREATGPSLTDRERGNAERTLGSIRQRTDGKFPYGVPARKPPLAALGFDLDGRLWVELSVPDQKSHEADVYGRTGKLLGTAEWPADIQLRQWAVRGDQALGVGIDSLGIQRVVRLTFRGLTQ